MVIINYAMIAVEMGIDRDVAECCIKEIISAFSRSMSQNNVTELYFKDIGKLVITNSKAKMKFTRDFLKSIFLDGRSASTLSMDNVFSNVNILNIGDIYVCVHMCVYRTKND